MTNAELQPLPLGTLDFSELRRDRQIYVDKTGAMVCHLEKRQFVKWAEFDFSPIITGLKIRYWGFWVCVSVLMFNTKRLDLFVFMPAKMLW